MNINNHYSENQLVHALKDGDINAFNVLFDRYGKRLLYFSMTYLKSEPEAEEIVQDVFFKIWNKRTTLSDSDSFEAFIFTIARNAILNTIRKSKSKRIYLEYAKLNQKKDIMLDDELDFNELHRAYMIAIEKLSPRRKEIFLLSREKALSNIEISKKLGISHKTVENQMTSAIHDIKKTLHSMGFSALIYIHLFL